MSSIPERQAFNEIPFYIPWIEEEEVEAVARALREGHLVGGGIICKRVEQQMQEMFGVKHVLLTTSCTHALELAMLALDIGPGDEVILPSFTFSSSANAVVLCGARPVFAEIRPDTLNIDPDDIRRRITPRTKAIMPVHYAGVGCDMDDIMAIAEEHGLYVVEDAAQGVGAKYKGHHLGTLGHVGCYSFHYTKNITCGEGGAFLTNQDEIAHKAEIIREKGTNRSAFLRGEVDKYSWVDRGSSYVLSDLLAALLEIQLKKLPRVIVSRQAIYERYNVGLKVLAEIGVLQLPVIPDECEPNYHIYYVLTRTPIERDRLISYLRAKGIGASFHYVPLHSSPFGRQLLSFGDDLAVTERISATLVRLPIYPSLSAEKQQAVINNVKECLLIP